MLVFWLVKTPLATASFTHTRSCETFAIQFQTFCSLAVATYLLFFTRLNSRRRSRCLQSERSWSLFRFSVFFLLFIWLFWSIQLIYLFFVLIFWIRNRLGVCVCAWNKLRWRQWWCFLLFRRWCMQISVVFERRRIKQLSFLVSISFRSCES